MATLTADAATAANQPKLSVVGPVVRVFDYYKTTTLSAGDVVLLDSFARVPHGATIVDCKLSGNTKDGTIIMVPFIRVGSTDTTMGSLTLSAAGRIASVVHSSAADSAHIPFTISVSDDAATRYATVGITIGTTASHTGSTSVSVLLTYVMDR
jgi:hypothetical protein